MTISNPGLLWHKTNAPVSSSRTDDIWFNSPDSGWAVNSNGQILKTDDGGQNWKKQHQDSSAYLRCVAFADANHGWVGSVSSAKRLFRTSDGGANWALVDNLPAKPSKICGLAVVDQQVIYGSGTNDPRDDPAIIKTTDGGATWTLIDMSAHAALLVDIHFETRDKGWVVGGRDVIACPGRRATRDVVRPVVLFTEDGGANWTNLIPQQAERNFPMGEWGWKIFFLNDNIAFVSLENFLDGAILKSTDGGKTWQRLRINDRQRNSNLEGVGFISEDVGWVGGWGSIDFKGGFTSETQDGGKNWDDADAVGLRLNRFRFFGKPVTVGYASGDTVYKYSTAPLAPAVAALQKPPALMKMTQDAAVAGPVEVALNVPEGARSLRADVWDRFGNHVEVAAQAQPKPGQQTIRWDSAERGAGELLGNTGILRVSIDEQVESSLVSWP